ncbi:MAG: UDP-N-acetylglucosamine diphosphorylase/glucosamine-1-phosphate N-acetyltransferase [Chloroflexi bacterium]|nr:UDP-N-acetylglucosamine diphosphorylase/glucosamine-1-phosphate N-acetyltransferase [Chloroflexi bacterium CFX1]MCK6569379.1 bifunctional UDP-N-acetylglucosamine diphosphorylase/glucosamine-1-phosphate N-acetyltransferase GlmU [Anaerolineales bacterium]MCQ3951715.1 UDP-N-acetylglucosamine diphosphorylase/glucosamine-1-phosphate N-acetyltransferase [Chloroflexota bacterium]MDL1917906.1 UDP-N-acetylglucosamine diphosphorylase/glucosamine-1-phosphate N-acetyltransferase [Chloroflexi bacterium CF
MKISAILLAAGQGTRMKSSLPKVLHPVAGKPMIWHALRAVATSTTEKPVVVIGHGADEVKGYLGESAQTVRQEPQLGTGHAVMAAENLLRGRSDLVVVCYADMPLLRGETLQKLVETQKQNKGPMSLLTVVADDPRGFGRIVRGRDGTVSAIVEEYVATPEQLQIKELNVGGYCFDAKWLWEALKRIPKNPKKGEYYLTDTVELAVKDGLSVHATAMDDLEEIIGVNTRAHLAEVEAAMRRRINEAHMLNGVTMIDPASSYIEADVKIGRDTTIMPNTYLQGKTELGEGNVVGPNTVVRDTKIGNGCKILASVLEGATLENDVDMGPFARLRKGAHLGNHVHMGNFGEVKDSHLAEGVKMGHFSYIGNAKIGANTNIGAGTITCNYDGEKKHNTEIGADVFIGSDTMLVAPLKLGDGSRTGAGAVVTKDVQEDTLVVGMPARAIRKLERKSKKK